MKKLNLLLACALFSATATFASNDAATETPFLDTVYGYVQYPVIKAQELLASANALALETERSMTPETVANSAAATVQFIANNQVTLALVAAVTYGTYHAYTKSECQAAKKAQN